MTGHESFCLTNITGTGKLWRFLLIMRLMPTKSTATVCRFWAREISSSGTNLGLPARGEEFVDLAKTAVLLHDIARFDEIRERFLGAKGPFDHSVAGGEKLRKIPLYGDVRITLPIKHHGHLIGDFYKDEEYCAIADPVLKEEVEKILFLIRDADKIANFNLMMYDQKMLVPLFVPYPEEVSDKRRRISARRAGRLLAAQPVDRRKIRTRADEMLGYVSWIYDLNYGSSAAFCLRLNLVDMMFDVLQRFHDDSGLNGKMRRETGDFVRERFGFSPLPQS